MAPLLACGAATAVFVVSHDNRRHPRYAVHLQVRFGRALDFVVEYADNLSVGGLFVRGAHTLEPLSEVQVELALPGYDRFTVQGRVAHVVGEAVARFQGRRPGAGIEIISSPPGFDAALSEYLRRLGRRRDVAVLVERGPALELLSAAGFQAQALPTVAELVAVMARSEHPVIALVVTPGSLAVYQQAARDAGVEDLVRALGDEEADAEKLLADLDELL